MPYSNRAQHSRAPHQSGRPAIRPGIPTEPHPLQPARLAHPARTSVTAQRMSINRLLHPTGARTATTAPSSIIGTTTTTASTAERPLTRRALHELQESLGTPRMPRRSVPTPYVRIRSSRNNNYANRDTNLLMPPQDIQRMLPYPIARDTRGNIWVPGPRSSTPVDAGALQYRPVERSFRVYRDTAGSTTHMNHNDPDNASQADTVSNPSTTSTLPDAAPVHRYPRTRVPVFAAHTEVSLSPSDASDCAADHASACPLCTRRKAVVRFGGCSHGVCVVCMKGVWWGRINREGHWPQVVPCALCRAEVESVRVVGAGGPAGGGMGSAQGVLDFMVERSATVRDKLRWEVIERVRPVELQPWLIFKHRQVFFENMLPSVADAQPPAGRGGRGGGGGAVDFSGQWAH
ncbi:hypothetical protein DFP73DRAFT_634421 [Morchella snyderi]|nr:hypothetical protein DFP73DRAFT_634421 [Morchella snyderi]